MDIETKTKELIELAKSQGYSIVVGYMKDEEGSEPEVAMDGTYGGLHYISFGVLDLIEKEVVGKLEPAKPVSETAPNSSTD